MKHIPTLLVTLIALSAPVVRAQPANAPATLATSAADSRTIEAPVPSGPYPVGRRFMVWTDSSRRDPVDSTRARELPIWIWYPAGSPPDAERQPVLPPEWQARRIETLAVDLHSVGDRRSKAREAERR